MAVKKENLSSFGTGFASTLAGICCIGPAIALVTGGTMGSLGFFMVLDPYRPWFLAAGAVMLSYSFFKLYVRTGKCECDADVRARRRSRVFFWVVASFYTVALTYQQVLLWVYG
jgi:mercuric ion transport protein